MSTTIAPLTASRRAVLAYRRFLAAYVDRYRAADTQPDVNEDGALCEKCEVYPATYQSQCFGCNASRYVVRT